VLASLNRPNIAAIRGLEDSAGVPALVMPLVEALFRRDVVRVLSFACRGTS
jgi:hypothetical protein